MEGIALVALAQATAALAQWIGRQSAVQAHLQPVEIPAVPVSVAAVARTMNVPEIGSQVRIPPGNNADVPAPTLVEGTPLAPGAIPPSEVLIPSLPEVEADQGIVDMQVQAMAQEAPQFIPEPAFPFVERTSGVIEHGLELAVQEERAEGTVALADAQPAGALVEEQQSESSEAFAGATDWDADSIAEGGTGARGDDGSWEKVAKRRRRPRRGVRASSGSSAPSPAAQVHRWADACDDGDAGVVSVARPAAAGTKAACAQAAGVAAAAVSVQPVPTPAGATPVTGGAAMAQKQVFMDEVQCAVFEDGAAPVSPSCSGFPPPQVHTEEEPLEIQDVPTAELGQAPELLLVHGAHESPVPVDVMQGFCDFFIQQLGESPHEADGDLVRMLRKGKQALGHASASADAETYWASAIAGAIAASESEM